VTGVGLTRRATRPSYVVIEHGRAALAVLRQRWREPARMEGSSP
jgi:hypothetical protein